MTAKKHTPTIRDVADLAGVSLGTVSKVINGKPVGESYVKKVNEAIKKLDYHVNSYAQGLKASRTYTVAVLIPNTTDPFYGLLVHHLNHSLTRRGYRMLLCCTDFDMDLEQEYVDMARQNKVDGIIGLTYNPNLQIDDDLPFVSIDRPIGKHPCVASDNFAGGQLAAQMLAESGCKKVAFLRTGSDLNNEPNKRKSGFENGCELHGLSFDMKILRDGDPDELFKDFLIKHIHGRKIDFDGLFCVTDTLAFIILQFLKELGFDAPADIQVIGFDGVQNPGKTGYVCSTIRQPVEDISEMCVDLLLQDSSTIKPPLVCLPVTFISAGTTKAI